MAPQDRNDTTDADQAEPAASGPADSAAAKRHFILGTAGHIDHGKTTLVRALTGVDTDRLPEEKRRGMTIDLGFAELQAEGHTFGIVDVPGHEKFVRTMVAGATGIDIALLIVAADDSVMPQTVEHVEIINLLGIREAVVALTKCDLVDAELVDLVEAEVHELLEGTALAEAPIVRCSGLAGTGIEELTARLMEAADRIEPANLDQAFRMPVDRVFTVAGRGTVVTGSVVRGSARRGDVVDIWPEGRQARIREIQTHNRPADSVHAGQRAAINLQGVGKDDLSRGCELAAVGSLAPTHLIDAHLHCLDTHYLPIKNHGRLRLCLGTREVMARCVLLTAGQLKPGESAYVQFRCREPLTATHGQRFIVRDENAARTAGGGVVLRAADRRISARMADEVEGLRVLHEREPVDRLAEAVRSARWHVPDEEHLALAAGVPQSQVRPLLDELAARKRVLRLEDGGPLLSRSFVEAFENRALAWLRSYHQRHPDDPGCLPETFRGWLERRSDKAAAKVLFSRILDSGRARMMGRYVCLKEFAPSLSAQDERILETVLARFHEAAFQPPSADELARLTQSNRQRIDKLLKVACSLGQLVQVDNTIHLHADREEELRAKARSLYETAGPFTVSELREALGSSRKYVVPIAEYLDRVGVTTRHGDKREVVALEKP